jgi:hypothetical protein
MLHQRSRSTEPHVSTRRPCHTEASSSSQHILIHTQTRVHCVTHGVTTAMRCGTDYFTVWNVHPPITGLYTPPRSSLNAMHACILFCNARGNTHSPQRKGHGRMPTKVLAVFPQLLLDLPPPNSLPRPQRPRRACADAVLSSTHSGPFDPLRPRWHLLRAPTRVRRRRRGSA